MHADKEPEPLNLGVPVVNFPRANAILARAQALLWVRDWAKCEIFRLFLLNCDYSNKLFLLDCPQFKRNRRNISHFAEKKRPWNQALRGCLYDPALPGRDEAEMQNDFDVLK